MGQSQKRKSSVRPPVTDAPTFDSPHIFGGGVVVENFAVVVLWQVRACLGVGFNFFFLHVISNAGT